MEGYNNPGLEAQGAGFVKYLFFHSQVKTGGPWDFKRPVDGPYRAERSRTYLVDKQLFRYDDLGNIHYGYVGSAGGIPAGQLYFFAGRNQQGSTFKAVRSGPPEWGDHRRDYEMIRKGVNMWND